MLIGWPPNPLFFGRSVSVHMRTHMTPSQLVYCGIELGSQTSKGVCARNTHDIQVCARATRTTYCGSDSFLPAVCYLTLSQARTCSRGHSQRASTCTRTDASDRIPFPLLSRRRVQHHEDSGAGVMSEVAPGDFLIENFHTRMHAQAYLDNRQTDQIRERIIR